MTLDLEILFERGQHPIANGPGGCLRRVALQNNNELITADAREIGALSRDLQPARRLPQQAVANQMAVNVVGFLEAVEIKAHDGKSVTGPGRFFERRREVFEQRGAVGKAGKRIVVCKMPDVLLGLPALGDVVENGQDILRLAVFVANGGLFRGYPAGPLGYG